MLLRFREIMILIHNGISFLPFLFRSRRCRTWCICMFAFPPHTSHVSLRSLSTISDLILPYENMTRSSMTGFLRRLSDHPPNVATRGFFFSRWMINCRHFRGPSDVFVVACRRFDSFVVLVLFLLAKVFRSDVSIVHLLLLSLGKQLEQRGMRAQKVLLRGPFSLPPRPFAHFSAPSRCSCGSHRSARLPLGSEIPPRPSV